MSDKLSNLASFGPSPGKIFTRVFVTNFLIVATISTAVTFLLPETYASTTTIKIERDENAANKSTYDPYFIQTQFEVINSPLVLDPVIEKFDLCELWGKKYFNGQQLKQIEAVEILKGRLGIAPVGNTKLAQITFYSEDKNEAAKLANAVAQSYQSLWVNQRAERSKTKVATLKVEYEKESQQIMTAMDKLDGLRKASEGTNAEATAAYTTARLEMQRMTDLHRLHYSKLKALEIDSVLPYSAVEITVPAEPGRSPIKPNKTLNIVLGIFGGVFAAGIIGGLAALVISVRRKRFQSSNAPV